MWTGRSAFVLGVIFRRTSAGSRVSESSTSARIGTARAATTAFAVAFHVYAGTITSSPGATPAPINPQMSADEPALRQSACFAPRCAANSRSKSSAS